MIDAQDVHYVIDYLNKRNLTNSLNLTKKKREKLRAAIELLYDKQTYSSAEDVNRIVGNILDAHTLAQLKTAIRGKKFRERNKGQYKHSYKLHACTQAKIIEIKQMLSIESVQSTKVLEFCIEQIHEQICNAHDNDDLEFFAEEFKANKS